MLREIKHFIYKLFGLYQIEYKNIGFLDGSYMITATSNKNTSIFGIGLTRKEAYNHLMFKLRQEEIVNSKWSHDEDVWQYTRT